MSKTICDLGLVLLLTGSLCAELVAQPPANPTAPAGLSSVNLSPAEGMIVLKNGQILRGQVTRSGNHVFLWLPDGEIRLTNNDVACVCRDLIDGYEQQRARLNPRDLRGHLVLGEWCVQHQLWEAARLQLAHLRDLDPAHPGIGWIERRLRLAEVPQPGDAPALNAGPLALDAPVADVAVPEPGLSSAALEKLIKKLPAGTMEEFVQHLQPLLANRCATAGCHGPGAQSHFALLRWPQGQLPRLRQTQRNFAALLPYVNPAVPAESLLLQQAAQAHGTAKKAAFQADEKSLANLQAWVAKIAPVLSDSPLPPHTAVGTNAAGMNAAGTNAVASTDGKADQPFVSPFAHANGSLDNPAAADAVTGAVPGANAVPRVRAVGVVPLPSEGSFTNPTPEIGPSSSRRELGPSISLPETLAQPARSLAPTMFQPRDPFDPEIFNRRFAPTRP